MDMPVGLGCYLELIAAAARPDDVDTLAFAGVISLAGQRSEPYGVPIGGLGRESLYCLLTAHFPGFDAQDLLAACPTDDSCHGERADEFADLLSLLLEHRSFDTDVCIWVAHAIATASMGGNHLWQDMGLPDRKALSQLIERNFTSLFVRNVGDMKWKKFFYRQLCERAEVLICKSPSCGVCVDYRVCFGPEDAVLPVPLACLAGAGHVA